MRTVLTEFIEELNRQAEAYNSSAKKAKTKEAKNALNVMCSTTVGIMIKANRMLEKEKQQIVDAYDSGWSDSAENQTAMCNSKNYYNETFNQ